MLKQLHISGFKCFDQVTLNMENLTLLTGINSAGKSSAIQAILLLMQQKHNSQNALNGKYTRLGLFQDIKNTVTNAKKIEIGITLKNDKIPHESKIFIDIDEKVQQENPSGFANIDLIYLSAERIGVEDVYRQNLMGEYRIGIHGEFAYDYLSQERLNQLSEPAFRCKEAGANLGNQVDYWLDYIMGYFITSERISGTEIVKVSYRKNKEGSREVKPQHVGTGISYIANVIIAALSCKKDSLFIVENPEIHLHPSAQSRLLDFFSFLASRGLQIIIETHSDHIFNGVRKSIKAGKIAQDNVSIYFFTQTEDQLSKPVRIQVDRNGVINNQEKGLFDQFDEDLDELLGL